VYRSVVTIRQSLQFVPCRGRRGLDNPPDGQGRTGPEGRLAPCVSQNPYTPGVGGCLTVKFVIVVTAVTGRDERRIERLSFRCLILQGCPDVDVKFPFHVSICDAIGVCWRETNCTPDWGQPTQSTHHGSYKRTHELSKVQHAISTLPKSNHLL
jgi:hypothetical protein